MWVVDRVEGEVAVLVEDGDDAEVVVAVAARLLGDRAVEGAILKVPLGEVGEPVWERAERDTEAEEARLAEADEVLDRLKARDPGGDVAL